MTHKQLRVSLLLASLAVFVLVAVAYYAFHGGHSYVGYGSLFLIAVLFVAIRILSTRMDALDDANYRARRHHSVD